MSRLPNQSFKDLIVWRQAMDLARASYYLTRGFPREELFGLTSQIRRAATSVPANIAEGNGRATRRDYVNFLHIAQGSLRELETLLLLAKEVNLAKPNAIDPLFPQVESIGRLLNRLIQSLTP
jgi:four helix bundle protein